MYGQSLRLAKKASREHAAASAVPPPSAAPNLRPSKKRAASEISGEKEEKKTFPRSLAKRRSAQTTPRCSCYSSKREPDSKPTKEERSRWAVPEDSDKEVGGEEVSRPVSRRRPGRSASVRRSKRIDSAQPRVGSPDATQKSGEEERTPLAEEEVRLRARVGPDANTRQPRLLICRLKIFRDTATSPSCRLQYVAKFFLEGEGAEVPCGEIEAWRLLASESWDELLHLDHAKIKRSEDTRGECARLLQTLFLPSGLIKPEVNNELGLSMAQDLMHIESVWIYDAFERMGLLQYVLRGFRLLVTNHALEERYRFLGVLLLAPGKFDDEGMSKCWKGLEVERVEEILMGVYERSGKYRVVVKDGLTEWFRTTVMGRFAWGWD